MLLGPQIVYTVYDLDNLLAVDEKKNKSKTFQMHPGEIGQMERQKGGRIEWETTMKTQVFSDFRLAGSDGDSTESLGRLIKCEPVYGSEKLISVSPENPARNLAFGELRCEMYHHVTWT